MSTAAQLIANKTNAQSSTGPRTPGGKLVSSQNAIKYGLTSKHVVLSCEDPAEFEARLAAFTEELHPATALERLFVDDISSADWRRARVQAAQTCWLDQQMKQGLDLTDAVFGKQLATFHKYESAYRRAYESAWKKLKALQKERKAADQPPPADSPAQKLQNKPKIAAAAPIVPALKSFADMKTPAYTALMASQPIYSFAKKDLSNRR